MGNACWYPSLLPLLFALFNWPWLFILDRGLLGLFGLLGLGLLLLWSLGLFINGSSLSDYFLILFYWWFNSFLLIVIWGLVKLFFIILSFYNPLNGTLYWPWLFFLYLSLSFELVNGSRASTLSTLFNNNI